MNGYEQQKISYSKGNGGQSTGSLPVKETVEDEGFRSQLEEAIKVHRLAVDGDKDAVGTAYGLFKALYEKHPQNTLVKAYMGSITSLQSRDMLDMIERMKVAQRGVKLLNQAVQADKDNIEIRLLRANVCLRLPEMFFHKTAVAIEDYSYILARVEKDSHVLTRQQFLRVLFDLGCACSNVGLSKQAEANWNKLLACEGGEEYKQAIQDQKGNRVAGAAMPKFAVPMGPAAAKPTAAEAVKPAEADTVKEDGTNPVTTVAENPKKKVWTRL